MTRILVADDERVALDRLDLAIRCVPGMTVSSRASNGAEALNLIRTTHPDIAILDIEMPGCTGFDVANAIKSQQSPPEVIFVTGSERNAFRAFEFNAVDYLLKPVAFERLREALRRAQERVEARQADLRFAELQKMLETLSERDGGGGAFQADIWVREKEGLTRIPVAEIDHFEAAGDYVLAHRGSEGHLVDETIASLEEALDPQFHIRTHRSGIVNLARVKGVRKRGRRSLSLVLESGATLPVGPKYADAVLAAVKLKRWR